MNTVEADRGERKLSLQLVLAAAGTIILWASAFPGIRAGLVGYAPVHLVLLRFLVASLALLLIAPFARIRVPQWRHMPTFVLLGLTGVTTYNLALSFGETHVSAGAASLLVNTGPIFTALLAVLFLKERLLPWGWLGLLMSFSGAVVIVLTSTSALSLNPWATIILLAAVLQSTSFILQKPLYAYYRPLELTSYAIWCGTLLNLVFLPGLTADIRNASLNATVAVVYLGLFPAALAYLMWAVVLSHLPTNRAGSLLYAVPVMTVVISWAWLGEVPNGPTLLGGSLAIGGVLIVNTLGSMR